MPDVTTLLDELAAYVANAAGLRYSDADCAPVPPSTAPLKRQLFVNRLDRASADPLASVLRSTGGPADEYTPTQQHTVQVLTQGETESAALARAWSIYWVFYAGGLPARGVRLTTWLLLRVDAMQKPSALGPLEGGGADVSFNWLIDAVPVEG
jgi:hypothetical protein